MDERTKDHRTADVELTLLAPDGKPLAGADVAIRQTRHKFLFGCDVFLLLSRFDPRWYAAKPHYSARFGEAAEVLDGYEAGLLGLMNYATLPFYWGNYESECGRPAADAIRAMAQWLRDRGLRLKGHPLCWHDNVPPWLENLPSEQVAAHQEARIAREVGEFRGLIDMWDAVNESWIMPDWPIRTTPIQRMARHLGRIETIRRAFAAARQANPAATLVLNDFERTEKNEAVIEQCLSAGIPIDVIGIQSHMHDGYWGAQRLWEICERFGRFGKPIHFTEVSVVSGPEDPKMRWCGPAYSDWATTPDGEARQARQIEEMYRLLVSHPSVEAITYWDLSDAFAFQGAPVGLLRKDMTPKPAYEILRRLIRDEWWTKDLRLTADKTATVRFRAFLGRYVARVLGRETTFDVNTCGRAAVCARADAQTQDGPGTD
jgi:GH35 family endo-1,4-beta-xylanase